MGITGRTTLLTAGAVLLYAPLGQAEDDRARSIEGMLERMVEHTSRDTIDARFMATAPETGELLPDVTIFDADGAPVGLRDLTSRGRHSVITFGCLT